MQKAFILHGLQTNTQKFQIEKLPKAKITGNLTASTYKIDKQMG